MVFYIKKGKVNYPPKNSFPQNEYTLINLGIKKITIDIKYSLIPYFQGLSPYL